MEINLQQQQQLKPVGFFSVLVVSPCDTHPGLSCGAQGAAGNVCGVREFPQPQAGVSLEVPGVMKDAQSWNSLTAGASSLEVLMSSLEAP